MRECNNNKEDGQDEDDEQGGPDDQGPLSAFWKEKKI